MHKNAWHWKRSLWCQNGHLSIKTCLTCILYEHVLAVTWWHCRDLCFSGKWLQIIGKSWVSNPFRFTGHFNHWLHPGTPRLLSLSATANAWRSKSGGKSSNLSMPVQCSIPGGLFISDWLKDKLWVKRDEAGKNSDDDDDDDDLPGLISIWIDSCTVPPRNPCKNLFKEGILAPNNSKEEKTPAGKIQLLWSSNI